MLNRIFTLYFIILFCFNSINIFSTNKDSIVVEKYKTHVTSLDYISRKTSNSKLYLNLAKSYCDSILKYDDKNEFALKFRDKINLTLSANELNMNHKIQLFDLFSGFPSYMGFADDPIEYAYDDAINELLLTKEIDFQKGPLGQSKIPSIITRKNCDDEMFEIANQIIIENTSHYIIPKHEVESIIGVENANMLINGNIDKAFLDAISNELNVNRIGIFEMNDLDLIENKIWYVQSSFYAYSTETGFTQTIFTRGFNHDKRDLSIINILLLLLESLILISIISFIDQNKKIRKIFNDKTEVSAKRKKFFELFINKIRHVFICFIIPLVFSFAMIYAVSNLIPNPEGDFREVSSRIWVLSLTIGMSLFPTLLNLIMVNRLDLDGFHTIKGYRLFFNTSLYATYFPIFIFYIIKFESIPRIEHVLLVLVTFTISWLLSKSYYRFTANSIHKNLKTQAAIGMIMAIISLLFLNLFILSDLTFTNLIYGFGVALLLAIIYELFDKRIQKINIKKEQVSTEQNLIENDIYIDKVLDPHKMIYEKIKLSMDDDSLNVMILSAPMGIGKTVSLKKGLKLFKVDDYWDTYYGDCDEIQDEGAISFEPFLEAFGDLLKIEKFSNRGDNIESMKDTTVGIAGVVGVNTDIVTDFERDKQKSMTETCIEIIDKLENVNKKMVFVLEDLHWIDPETYSFLKHFIEIINNNEFLRESICIILTLRNGKNSEYRGVDESKLREDLANINEQEDFKFDVEELYNFKTCVELKDFVKHLSDQDNAFKIQSYTMNQINNLFNYKLSEDDSKFVLTPLYIRKTIEGWIEDKTLKYSPDGYLLTRTLSMDDLPNTDEVDKYYHSIFNSYDEKWQRLLESAAIIGNRFDAEILAKVWGYELLDILSFLEKAVRDDLLKDLSAEDNMYRFTDKRIVTALKSFFSVKKLIKENKSNKDNYVGEKQIVIEYNKRYISLQQDILQNPDNYSYEKLMQVCRRLSSLITHSQFRKSFEKLVLEIAVRLISQRKNDKLKAFSKFIEKSTKLVTISKIIENFSFMTQTSILSNEKIEEKYQIIKNLYQKSDNDKFISHFFIIISLYKGKILDESEYNFLYSNCFDNIAYSSFMSFEILSRLTEQKRDFGFKFSLYEKFKNSVSDRTFEKYQDKINMEIYWLHTLKNEQNKSKSKSNPYNDSWPDAIELISDTEIFNNAISIIERSSDHILNADIFRLINLICFNNDDLHDKAEIIYNNINNYLNNDQSLIIPVMLRLLDNNNLSKKIIKDKAKKWEEIDKYFQSRYNPSSFNKLIKLYYAVKKNKK